MSTMLIDISHHHPVKDWSKVKSSCPFIISKATEGTTVVDSTLDSFIKNCESNKIPYWLYAFIRKGDGKEQAKFMVDKCKNKVGKYFVGYIIDAEKQPSLGTYPTDAQIKDAINYVKSTGYKYGLYTGYADYTRYEGSIKLVVDKENCFWWESRYGKNDGTYNTHYPCHSKVDLHQFTDQGSFSAVSGKIDVNRICGDKDIDWFKTPLKSTSGSTSSSTSGTTSNSTTTTVSTYYKKYTGSSSMVDVVLTDIGVPASYRGSVDKRAYVAGANNIAGYEGSAEQNLKIISLAKSGKLKKVTSSTVPSKPIVKPVTYYKKYTGSSLRIDEVFRSIGVPAKYIGKGASARKPIAEKNGISGYTGSLTQNLKLIRIAKKGTLKQV